MRRINTQIRETGDGTRSHRTVMVQIEEPVYVISIAARLVGMHPQSLRLYERIGLIRPAREGNKRLYSVQDIERLRRIQHLTQDMGVNLAGVEIVFDLLAKMEAMRDEMMEHIAEMEAEMRREMEKGNRREGE